MTEFEVDFNFSMRIEAGSEEEAKEIATDVLHDHLNQITLRTSDFEVIDRYE